MKTKYPHQQSSTFYRTFVKPLMNGLLSYLVILLTGYLIIVNVGVII